MPLRDGAGAPAALTYQTVKGTTDVSTTSTAFVDMPDMALTVAESGTYLITFSTSCMVSNSAGAMEIAAMFRLLKDSAVLAYSFIYIYITLYMELVHHAGNAPIAVVEALTAGQVVKVQWRAYNPAGATGTVSNRPATQYEHRALTIIKLA